MGCRLIDKHWSVLRQCAESTGVNSASRPGTPIVCGGDSLDSSSLFTTAVL
jgi:hypothetical protein